MVSLLSFRGLPFTSFRGLTAGSTKPRKLNKKTFLRLTFCITALFALAPAAYSLPVVESRTGQPQSKAPSNDHVQFYGAPQNSAEEPLIPASTASTPYSEMNSGPNTVPANAPERAARLTLKEVESLQREVSELRGIIEVQDHEIKQLKKSQQDFYIDLDRRLSQLQNTGSKNAAATSKSTAKEGKNKTAPVPSSDPITKNPPSTKGPVSAQKTAGATSSKPLEQTNAKTSSVQAQSAASVQAQPAAVEPPNSVLETANVVTSAVTPVPSPSPSPENSSENMAYQAAYNLVKTKRYEEAVQSFQKYLKQFPDGEHVANAHYWLGEVYMVQWQSDKSPESLDKAQSAFTNIAKGYPNHTKTADAALKLGLIELDKGNQEAAKEKLMDVKSRYPGTAAARVAESRLRQLP